MYPQILTHFVRLPDPLAATVETPHGEPRGASPRSVALSVSGTLWGALSSVFRPSRRLSGPRLRGDAPRGSPQGVFHEKAPDVKAAKAAFLIDPEVRAGYLSPSLPSALSRSPSMGSVHEGVHRCGAAISTTASKAKTSQRSRHQRGFDSSSDLRTFPSPALATCSCLFLSYPNSYASAARRGS
jgi:hypothetical protein